jgi:hypothetical protein
MKKSIHKRNNKQVNLIVDNDWKRDKYITTVSSIGKNEG